MKKYFLLFKIITSLLLIQFPSVLLADISIGVSTNLLLFDYEEFDDSGKSLDREHGFIPGFGFRTSYIKKQWEHQLELERFSGKVSYDGQLQNGLPHTTETHQTLYNLGYKLIWYAFTNKNYAVFGKYAYHQWGRDIIETATALGLYERYSWLSFSIGGKIDFINNGSHRFTSEFSVFRTHKSDIKIDQSDEGYGKPVLALGNRIGGSAALIYSYGINKNQFLQLRLQHTFWQFLKSESKKINNGQSVRTIREPDSTSNQTLMGISLKQTF